MNRINPFYVIAGLVVLLLFMMMQLHNKKIELVELTTEYKEVKALSNELVGLKKVYANETKTKKMFQKILRASILKRVDLESNYTKKGVKVSSKSIDRSALNYLMGKVLNASFKIVHLDIEKLSETKASLNMEIKW